MIIIPCVPNPPFPSPPLPYVVFNDGTEFEVAPIPPTPRIKLFEVIVSI